MTKSPQTFFATTPKGLELLLVDELKSLGAIEAREKLAGVQFSGDLALAYKACLWSRLANRILLPLNTQPASTPEALYAAIQSIDWSEHLSLQTTFAVHFVSAQSKIDHTLFGAQKVKDAIVDQFRDRVGDRPSISRIQPDVSIYVYLHRDIATVYLDLSGESLHKRGYRLAGGAAPLKENLAAAILVRAKWPQIAAQFGTLLDPMCGSGTLLIEAAYIAGDIAPGLNRDYFGFLGWKQHQPALWEALMREAETRREVGMKKIPTIVGYDQDPDAITFAFDNIERAGLKGVIHVEKRELASFVPKPNCIKGLVVTNPPYGERLGDVTDLQPLYLQLGTRLKEAFQDWKVAVFTGNPELGKEMGLRAEHFYALFNGAIPCKLFLFSVVPTFFVDRTPSGDNARRISQAKRQVQPEALEAVQMFVNRVKKNMKHRAREASRINADTYRVYDADLPEYSFAIDIAPDKIIVQEYQAPKTVDPKKVLQRQQAVLSVLPELFEVAPQQIFFSILSRHKH